MNYRVVLRILGNVIKYMIALLVIPFLIALYYGDGDAKAFFITMIIGVPLAHLLSCIKAERKAIYAKEGFLIVGLAWIMISVIGAIPFVISRAIPNFIDAFFETVSGFTTTGATILTQIEGLPRGILFWRNFTHWIGGMGFLIFMLALIPSLGSNSIHLLKAESPGPSPGKIVPKIKETAKILYLIYFVLTIVEALFLMFAGMNLYDALIHAMGTAGTGGFSNMNESVAAFHSPLIEWIITIFMIIFGINFALYFQILKGNIKGFLKNEELRYYLLTIFCAFIFITFNILKLNRGDIMLSIRQSAFQVSSIITSTGFATVDYNFWPTLSKMIIIMLMFVGAMAGSTGGGIKTVRIVIILKAIKREINKIVHPKRINSVKIDGKAIDEEIIHGVFLFIGAYIIISLIAIFIISFDNFDVLTTVTSVITTMSNIGPGLEMVGPAGNFSAFSSLSKLILSFCMLAGRLEIYPMLIMFSPSIWRKNY
ncbi:TrkH family potassium uptake protein [uncultured Clostridium sp.]|uniref:TrkH family potassium uptake protein n=1 Tax=uncultured Clostridium sp. TaxID=59620 RepID=UPI0025E3A16C|nr:TrkH family potassium uptake protein [uncultured Clostridium sp.]